MTDRYRKLLVGAVAFLALASSVHGQIRNQPPVVGRPKPQKPVEIPPGVVVLQIDTSAGDSTRTIMQRDFDYGDRMQPLILDSATLDDIWRPGQKNINFSPLAQTRANFVVRARPTSPGRLFPASEGSTVPVAGDQRFSLDPARQKSGRDD